MPNRLGKPFAQRWAIHPSPKPVLSTRWAACPGCFSPTFLLGVSYVQKNRWDSFSTFIRWQIEPPAVNETSRDHGLLASLAVSHRPLCVVPPGLPIPAGSSLPSELTAEWPGGRRPRWAAVGQFPLSSMLVLDHLTADHPVTNPEPHAPTRGALRGGGSLSVRMGFGGVGGGQRQWRRHSMMRALGS